MLELRDLSWDPKMCVCTHVLPCVHSTRGSMGPKTLLGF